MSDEEQHTSRAGLDVAVFDTLREPLLVLDDMLHVVAANHAFYEKFKVTPHETLGVLISEIGDRQWDVAALRKLLEEVLTANAEFDDFMVEHDFPTIGRRTMLLNGRGICDSQKARQILLAIEDLTHQRQDERKLLESEAFNRSLMDGSPDCLKVLDLSGHLLNMNQPGLCQMEIDDPETVYGKQWASLWPKEAEIQIQDAMTRALHGVPTEFEAMCPTFKGTVKWWGVTVNPIRDDSGRIVRVLAGSRDITERKELEAERARLLASEIALRAEAETANRSKDMFLATLSHEMRTPLSAIVGWVQILLRSGKDRSPEEVEEGLQIIDRNVKTQIQLMDDVLDVSRIVSGKLRLELAPCDLIEVVKAALEVVQISADAKHIQLDMQLEMDAGNAVCDGARIQQVVWNLLSNAIKFTPKGGRISITLRRVASGIDLIIRDNGQGIPADLLPFVFDRFRQADSSTRRRFGGLGLGLSIVKHLVEAHGGTIRAESDGEGKGATFTITLPIRAVRMAEDPDLTDPNRPSAQEGVPAFDELTRLDGLHVLLVDDEQDARTVLCKLLELAGATVSTADSARSARERLAELIMNRSAPHILVSDLGMPEEDGLELIRSIRQAGHAPRDLPAVALTAFAQKDYRREALLAGFQVHVAKPAEPIDLTAAIASLTGRTGQRSHD